MSFAVSSWRDALGVPSTKIPFGVTTFASYILPPVVCYIVAAVLAVTFQTRALRVAVWPVVTLLAVRAGAVNMSRGDPDLKGNDIALCMGLGCIVIHTLSWAVAKKPLVRHLRPANSSPSVIMDALDLATNLRGHGWDWAGGIYIPRETPPTNRIVFACHALLSWAAHGLACVTLYVAFQTFITGAGSTPHGSTIIDETLPFLVRYLRASIISILAASATYCMTQMSYSILTVPGILLLGQDPAQWPPVFDSPWRSTSLTEFWGCRWQQMYRHMFLLGAYPFTVVLGRAGTVIGAFLSSAILHALLLTLFDGQLEMWRMLIGFGMMAPGVLAERVFYRSTGKKVGGVVGWVWTMTWVLLWGHVIIDGFARAGLYVSSGDFRSWLPLCALVEKLVIAFDAWLHTI